MERETVGPSAVTPPALTDNPVIKHLFRTKPIDQILADADHPAHRLKKTLTAWDLTCLGIGAIIGTGIFVLTGHAAAQSAGPGIMVSFVITGTLCALNRICV